MAGSGVTLLDWHMTGYTLYVARLYITIHYLAIPKDPIICARAHFYVVDTPAKYVV